MFKPDTSLTTHSTLTMISIFIICSILHLLICSAKLYPYDYTQSSLSLSERMFKTVSATGNNPFSDVTYKSGYINVGEFGSEMFYWYFPSTVANPDNNVPFIIWLTGGPGCSSEIAALTENGPLTFEQDGTVKLNDYSWNHVADVLYIDQPVGTGFSKTGDIREIISLEKDLVEEAVEFLRKFVDLYPSVKGRPFFITGESYAGHYIPPIARALIEKPIEDVPLKGIAIGNGWVDPAIQYPSYADYAYENKMISTLSHALAVKAYQLCVDLLKKKLWPIGILECNAVTHSILGKTNPYDIRLNCEVPPMCYNQTALINFMNTSDVRDALGAKTDWTECNLLVYLRLMKNWVSETRTEIGALLDGGIDVLIYNGDKDFICNWKGASNWVHAVPWAKQADFAKVAMQKWEVNGQPAGEYKKLDKLTFLRVYDSGHMVPMDQPAVALEMITSFFFSKFPELETDHKPFKEIDFELNSPIQQKEFSVVS